MQHRDITYQLIQMVGSGKRPAWKWLVTIKLFSTVSGTEPTRNLAEAAAIQAIDRALGPKVAKVKLVPRQP